jgi:thiazole synthase
VEGGVYLEAISAHLHTRDEVCLKSRQNIACFSILYLQKINFSSSHLCEFGVFVFKRDLPSDQNSSKKPVNPPKFMFQHSVQTLCPAASMAKFGQSQNLESLPSFPWLPSVQLLSRSRIWGTNSSKKPVNPRKFTFEHSAEPLCPGASVVDPLYPEIVETLSPFTIRASALILAPMFKKQGNLTIAGREFKSRLILGTGKFASPRAMQKALEASGAEMVTVALRRADLSGKRDPFANILEFIDSERFLLLPNTSGAMNAEEAVRLARLAAATGLPKWIKLEIHPDPRYLLPDPIETLKATEILVKEGFTVLPYINADPVLAKRLEEAGSATVMPLGSPIGSNRGVETRGQIRIIIEQATVPVVVDAGLGAPSHAAEAMELGADAVLINTAIAVATDPSRMAVAFRQAVEAGRTAYEVGFGSPQWEASATSPLTGFLDELETKG